MPALVCRELPAEFPSGSIKPTGGAAVWRDGANRSETTRV